MSFDKCRHSCNLQHNHDMKHFLHPQNVRHVLSPNSSRSDMLSVTVILPFLECMLQNKVFWVRHFSLSSKKQ